MLPKQINIGVSAGDGEAGGSTELYTLYAARPRLFVTDPDQSQLHVFTIATRGTPLLRLGREAARDAWGWLNGSDPALA